MWVSDGWKDYELLDASGGERLERWGEFFLVRPDPSVLWDTPRSAAWKHVNARYHRSKQGGGSWEIFELPEQWSISYELSPSDILNFFIRPFSFKHTGVFPEQAANWSWTYGLLKHYISENKAAEPPKVLNLFAYTGGATIAAASAGAAVTHVDAARGMVTVAHENADASGLSDAKIRWIVDDCMKFVEREGRRGNRYQGIIMDPPSYGRGPKGEIWKLEEGIHELIKKTAELLAEDAVFYLINSYTTGIAPGVLTYMVGNTLGRRGGRVESEELGLRVGSTGRCLPCGVSSRWSEFDHE